MPGRSATAPPILFFSRQARIEGSIMGRRFFCLISDLEGKERWGDRETKKGQFTNLQLHNGGTGSLEEGEHLADY